MTMGESTGTKRDREVVFFPLFERNPYQGLLIQGLDTHGWRVRASATQVVKQVLSWFARPPAVLHLHWLHVLYERRGNRPSWLVLHGFRVILTLLRLRGVSIVWTAHNIAHHDRASLPIDRYCTAYVSRIADAVIAHSHCGRERLLSELPELDGRIVSVIPHGNYLQSYPNEISKREARERLGLDQSELVILLFGIIRSYKGTEELLDAFGQLDQPNVRLLIVGRPADAATDASVRGRTEPFASVTYLPGFVADEDVQLYLNACDAVVLPYRDILTSAVAILALSFGRACIAPDLDYFKELLDDEGTLFYGRDDPSGLRDALERATQVREAFPAMGEHNFALAQALDWDSIAEQTIAVYARASTASS